MFLIGLPWWLSGKESACQCRRCGFDPWNGKISRRKWQSTPVYSPVKYQTEERATVHVVAKVRQYLASKQQQMFNQWSQGICSRTNKDSILHGMIIKCKRKWKSIHFYLVEGFKTIYESFENFALKFLEKLV